MPHLNWPGSRHSPAPPAAARAHERRQGLALSQKKES